jgi:hypothetical protein
MLDLALRAPTPELLRKAAAKLDASLDAVAD